jgi:hypothetical protein
MSDEHHDIPSWYIPDEEVVLANEHEKEQIEEQGELEQPLCPHCGRSYIDKSGGTYTHDLVRVEPDFPTDDYELKPGVVCVNGEKRYMNGATNPLERRNNTGGYL